METSRAIADDEYAPIIPQITDPEMQLILPEEPVKHQNTNTSDAKSVVNFVYKHRFVILVVIIVVVAILLLYIFLTQTTQKETIKEVKPPEKVETKPEVKEVKPEIKPEIKPEVKPEAKIEVIPDQPEKVETKKPKENKYSKEELLKMLKASRGETTVEPISPILELNTTKVEENLTTIVSDDAEKTNVDFTTVTEIKDEDYITQLPTSPVQQIPLIDNLLQMDAADDEESAKKFNTERSTDTVVETCGTITKNGGKCKHARVKGSTKCGVHNK